MFTKFKVNTLFLIKVYYIRLQNKYKDKLQIINTHCYNADRRGELLKIKC